MDGNGLSRWPYLAPYGVFCFWVRIRRTCRRDDNPTWRRPFLYRNYLRYVRVCSTWNKTHQKRDHTRGLHQLFHVEHRYRNYLRFARVCSTWNKTRQKRDSRAFINCSTWNIDSSEIHSDFDVPRETSCV